MPLAEFWGLKFMEAGMAPPNQWIPLLWTFETLGKIGSRFGKLADSPSAFA